MVIDDLELVAPARVISGDATWGERRAVAALVGFLDDLKDHVAVIGVCGQVGSLWPGLVRSGRFGRVVSVGEVTEKGRREAALNAIQGLGLQLGEEEENVVRSVAKLMRGCGFSEVGKVIVGAVIEDDIDRVTEADGGFTEYREVEGSKTVIIESSKSLAERIIRAAEGAKPVVLEASGGQWVGTTSSTSLQENTTSSYEVSPLVGLEKELEVIRGCLTAAFILETAKKDTPAARALSNIGCPRGLLLYGPSGCGKTSITLRIASLYPGFIRVVRAEAAEIFSSTVGYSERAIKSLFSSARTASPAVVVIENIDVIAPRRRESAAAFSKRIVSTLLTEIDGVIEHEKSIFVLCTAQDTTTVDPALLRPGRLDMRVKLGPLYNEEAVKALVHTRATKMKCSLGDSLEHFAKQMVSWTPAEIVALCNDAGLRACREQYKSIDSNIPVNALHFQNALQSALKNGVPPD